MNPEKKSYTRNVIATYATMFITGGVKNRAMIPGDLPPGVVDALRGAFIQYSQSLDEHLRPLGPALFDLIKTNDLGNVDLLKLDVVISGHDRLSIGVEVNGGPFNGVPGYVDAIETIGVEVLDSASQALIEVANQARENPHGFDVELPVRPENLEQPQGASS